MPALTPLPHVCLTLSSGIGRPCGIVATPLHMQRLALKSVCHISQSTFSLCMMPHEGAFSAGTPVNPLGAGLSMTAQHSLQTGIAANLLDGYLHCTMLKDKHALMRRSWETGTEELMTPVYSAVTLLYSVQRPLSTCWSDAEECKWPAWRLQPALSKDFKPHARD